MISHATMVTDEIRMTDRLIADDGGSVLCRPTPKVEARCVNRARWDLCGEPPLPAQ